MADLEATIEAAWTERDTLSPKTRGPVRNAVEQALAELDKGRMRVAEKRDGTWVVNQWLKKAVLLSFRLNDMSPIAAGPGGAKWWDKVPSKFDGWTREQIQRSRVSAPCRTASCAIRPISRRASC